MKNSMLIEKSLSTPALVPAMCFYWINAGMGLLKYKCFMWYAHHKTFSSRPTDVARNGFLSSFRYMDYSSNHLALANSFPFPLPLPSFLILLVSHTCQMGKWQTRPSKPPMALIETQKVQLLLWQNWLVWYHGRVMGQKYLLFKHDFFNTWIWIAP